MGRGYCQLGYLETYWQEFKNTVPETTVPSLDIKDIMVNNTAECLFMFY
jgi:hypothetical protein